MPTLILEDIPGDVYEQIQRQAQAESRTISEEAVRLLREGLRPQQPTSSEAKTPEPLVEEPVQSTIRLPSHSDVIRDTGEMSPPCSFPRPGVGVQVPTQSGGARLPTRFVFPEHTESDNV